ncbi:hypothetical protein ACFL2J_07585 [Candidatus Omnitrophota bacterium]
MMIPSQVKVKSKAMFIKSINNKIKIVKSEKAFSFVELMFSLTVLLIIVVGLMYTYVVCFKLNNASRNLTLVNNALQAQLESIIATPFDDLSALNGTTFTLNGFSAEVAVGNIDIYDSVYVDLKYVRLVACWEDSENRIIGEDINLDGVLLAAEDIDSDGVVDSPVELVTLISRDN